MKIEINGRKIEVDPEFATWDEEKQHQYIDDVARDLGPVQTATQAQTQEGPDVLSNVGAGAEAVALRAGVGVPKFLLNSAKNYFTPSAAPAPTMAPRGGPTPVAKPAASPAAAKPALKWNPNTNSWE